MAEKRFRPKFGNEGLTVEFPGTEGYATIGPKDWPYTPKNASEEVYLDNLDEVTDRPPPKKKPEPPAQTTGSPTGSPSDNDEGGNG